LRCFKKSNPFIQQTINGDTFGGNRYDSINNDNPGPNYVNVNVNSDNLNRADDAPDNFGDEWDGTPYEKYEFLTRKTFTCDGREWVDQFKFKRSCGENLTYYQCVYVNKCCYRPNFLNQPACYKPELLRGTD